MSHFSRAAAHDVGLALLVPSGLALTGAAVAAASGAAPEAWAFVATALGGGLLGGGAVAAFRKGRQARGEVTKARVALAWLAASLLAAVPFWWIGAAPEAGAAEAVFGVPLNAVFESVSGLTSTGLSVTPDSSQLPASLQWWRSALQWVGGIGILYAVLLLMPDERDQPHTEEMREEMSLRGRSPLRMLAAIWALYAGYTLATAVAFWFAGMPAWEAVNHGMTALATGGFAITGQSFAGYSRTIQGIAMVAMALGAVSFGVHYALVAKGRVYAAIRDSQNRLMAALLLAGTALLWLATALGDLPVPLFDVAFQWTSALLTAGFSTQTVSEWSALPLALILLAMFVGGASGSTAGGLKQNRAIALLRWRRAGPHGETTRAALRQVGRLGTALALGTLALAATTDAGWMAAAFEAGSALGTVGLSSGLTGPDAPAGARLTLTVLMWVGRLEVAAVLALFARR